MKDIKIKDRIAFNRCLLFLVLFLGIEGSGQDKKALTPAGYERWYHIFNYGLSPDGKWTRYSIKNPKGKDSMVLRKIGSPSKQVFMGAADGRFSPKADWYVFLREGQLCYQSLRTGKSDTVKGIDNYAFSKGGKYLIGERKKEKELLVLDLDTKALQVIPCVESHALSPDSTRLALIRGTESRRIVQIWPFAKNKMPEGLAQFDGNISGLTWNSKGDGLAFFEAAPQQENDATHNELHYLKLGGQQALKVARHQSTASLRGTLQVPVSRLFFSSDDAQLFFDVRREAEKKAQSGGAIIWSSAAKILPPPADDGLPRQFLMCWHLKSDEFISVNDGQRHIAIPAASGRHALEIDDQKYLPFFRHGGLYVDLYCKDLKTGLKKAIAQKVHNQKNHIGISPQGKYITWFKDNNWWIYDIAKDRARCLTCSESARFENWEHDYPGDKYPNDRPYWAAGDRYLLLSDFYDVWLFTPDGKTRKQLTRGSVSKSKFRVYDKAPNSHYREQFIPYTKAALDFEKGVFLSEVNTNTLEEGMHFFELGEALKPVVYTDDKIRDIQKAGDSYLYVLSDFDKSPELVVQKGDQAEGVVMQRSNEHQKEYHWGKSELIHYAANGASLKGALFYPADYQPGKKYPLIVKPYYIVSDALRLYEPPSTASPIGINVSHLTQSGYFVLYPDIHFTVNKPGESALKCVNAAVDKAIESASIDRENMGLFGFSFGGYLVSYMIGQTGRFKTAVAGGGFHDLMGTYLGTDDKDTSSMWRFETQQIRITEPFYSEAFFENSPINHAHRIETPLLLWIGQNDTRIRGENSSRLQMALWRLGKQSTFLIYPDEPHFILNKENQLDLTEKTMRWFDYYLRDQPKPIWMD